MNSPVLFALATSRPDRVLAWAEARHASWDWIFLSADFTKLQQWRAGLGGAFAYVPIYQELESSAQRLKQPYLRWLAELGHRHPEPAWWASRISERNTAVNSLFEDICRLDAVRKLLHRSDHPTLIVADSPALLATLNQADWLRSRQRLQPLCAWFPSRLTAGLINSFLCYSRFAMPVMSVARAIKLLIQVVQAKFAGMAPLPIGCTNVVLLHTYLEESAFAPDGKFSDRYFPGLAAFLEKEGYQVLVLPVMFNVKRSLFSAWTWTKSSTTRFVNPYALYRFSDYVFALGVARRAARLPSGPLMFGETNLSVLVRAESAKTAFGALSSILYLRLPLRLRERGVDCSAVLAEFENMIPEKMLIQGFRKYLPNTELIGFQHGALYPHLLCNFTPVEERDIAPMYDRVVCNGPLFRDILVSEGMAPDRAVVGAALRYRHLWEQLAMPSSASQDATVDVFVPLPLMLPAGVELLMKLLEAFEANTKLRILLKAHPMTSVEALLRVAGGVRLPPHFRTTDSALSAILPLTRIVIGLSTSTMFEAVAAGVPVIRVRRDTALDLDPLGFFGDLYPLVCSAAELASEVERILALADTERDKLSRRGKDMLAMAFRPCDDVGFRAFLPTRGRAGTSVRHCSVLGQGR